MDEWQSKNYVCKLVNNFNYSTHIIIKKGYNLSSDENIRQGIFLAFSRECIFLKTLDNNCPRILKT